MKSQWITKVLERSPGDHEWLYKNSWQCIPQLLRYFSLNQSGHLTIRQTGIALHIATLLAWLKTVHQTHQCYNEVLWVNSSVLSLWYVIIWWWSCIKIKISCQCPCPLVTEDLFRLLATGREDFVWHSRQYVWVCVWTGEYGSNVKCFDWSIILERRGI